MKFLFVVESDEPTVVTNEDDEPAYVLYAAIIDGQERSPFLIWRRPLRAFALWALGLRTFEVHQARGNLVPVHRPSDSREWPLIDHSQVPRA